MATAEYQREWRRRNPNKASEYCKNYREANPDKILKSRKKWRSNNKEKIYQSDGNYRLLNKDKINSFIRNRRARKRNSEGFHSEKDIQQILLNQNYLCNGCFCYLSEYEIDHIIPLIRGGTNWPSNLQALCPHCNASKSSKTMEEWAEYKQKTKE